MSGYLDTSTEITMALVDEHDALARRPPYEAAGKQRMYDLESLFRRGLCTLVQQRDDARAALTAPTDTEARAP